MFQSYLNKIGHHPIKVTNTSIVYQSPFNSSEKTPSFLLFKSNSNESLKEYNYKCNSTGNGGDLYHFVMKYNNVNFLQAKKILTENLNIETPNTSQTIAPKPILTLSKQIPSTIRKMGSLSNVALVEYLESRGITHRTALKYVSEVYYERDNKNYFALSFYNDSGSMEVRNKYFKGTFGKKDISIISPYPNQTRLKWFEGFMDFLSYIEVNDFLPTSDYLILNSLSLTSRALKAIEHKYDIHELYLDNDKAGDKAVAEITEFFGNQGVEDKRGYYKDFKDLNELLMAKKDEIKEERLIEFSTPRNKMLLKGFSSIPTEDLELMADDKIEHNYINSDIEIVLKMRKISA